MSAESRFWAKVSRVGPIPKHVPGIGACWVWTAAKNHAGYGSWRAEKGNSSLVHRSSWEFANGRIPSGMFVLHRCDSPSCVRPSHLFLGTHRDNAADRKAKGRCGDHKGSKNGSAVLLEKDVELVRARILSGDTAQDVAVALGVSRQAISLIATGGSWADVPWPEGASFPIDCRAARAARWQRLKRKDATPS